MELAPHPGKAIWIEVVLVRKEKLTLSSMLFSEIPLPHKLLSTPLWEKDRLNTVHVFS